MALIREAAGECGFGKAGAGGNHLAGELNSALDEIGMRRCADFAEESPQKLKATDAG